MKTKRAIVIGTGIWLVAVAFYTFSYQIPVLEDLNQQANIVLFAVVMPLVWFGSHIYYKKDRSITGVKLGSIMLLTAAFLDALVTVPLFVIPNGGNHYSFFTDLSFWIIAFEFITVATLYYYTMVNSKTQNVKLN